MKHVITDSFKSRNYKIVVLDEESVVQTPGIDLTVTSSYNHANATRHSFLDESELREKFWNFQPSDVVLDVGAAFGSYSITAAVQNANVFAFEPSLFCRSILEENIMINSELSNIQVLPIGLHHRTGWFDPDKNEFHDSFISSNCLKVTSLDEMEKPEILERINMIKIDVEGGELEVLKGAELTLKKHLPRLLIEEHEFKIGGIGSKCEDFLQKIGYGAPIRIPHHAVSHSYYESPR